MADQPLWVPNKRLLMPELFERGRKPVGPVQIDWDNEFAKGISNCVITGAGGAINLISNELADRSKVDSGVNRGNETGFLGQAAFTNNADLYVGGEWTVATVHYYRKDYATAGGQADYVLRVTGATLTTTYLNYIDNQRPLVKLDDAIVNYGAYGVTVGTKGQLALSYSASNGTGAIYHRYDDTFHSYTSDSIVSAETDCYVYFLDGTTPPRAELIVTWNETKSKQFLDGFFANPYQILKPAIDVPLAIYYETAAPEGAIAPLHYHHRLHNRAG